MSSKLYSSYSVVRYTLILTLGICINTTLILSATSAGLASFSKTYEKSSSKFSIQPNLDVIDLKADISYNSFIGKYLCINFGSRTLRNYGEPFVPKTRCKLSYAIATTRCFGSVTPEGGPRQNPNCNVVVQQSTPNGWPGYNRSGTVDIDVKSQNGIMATFFTLKAAGHKVWIDMSESMTGINFLGLKSPNQIIFEVFENDTLISTHTSPKTPYASSKIVRSYQFDVTYLKYLPISHSNNTQFRWKMKWDDGNTTQTAKYHLDHLATHLPKQIIFSKNQAF